MLLKRGISIKKSTLNYSCIKGKVKLVLFDRREKSETFNKLYELILTPEKHTFNNNPAKYLEWFKGLDDSESIIANCLDFPHDEKEMVRTNHNDKKFNYKW